VLSGRDGRVRISERTRQAVLEAARQLGYTPDLGARRLRQGAAAAPAELTLAILRPAGSPLALTVRLLEAAAHALGPLASPSQLVLEEYQPGRLAEQSGIRRGSRFHGAIITSPTPDDEQFLEGTALAVPVVVFQRQMSRPASVDVDNVSGGLIATRHLLAKGRRRIAAIGWSQLPSGALERRLAGYREALRRAGLAGEERIVHATSFSEAGGAAAAADLLATQAPDAILALSDVVALGVLSAVHRAGRRIPDDIAVLGYDDLPFAPFLEPSLTTVRLPYASMGEDAIAGLADAVRGRADGMLHRVYQPELIVRRSA
jgi:LacI family transcriptional regulator